MESQNIAFCVIYVDHFFRFFFVFGEIVVDASKQASKHAESNVNIVTNRYGNGNTCTYIQTVHKKGDARSRRRQLMLMYFLNSESNTSAVAKYQSVLFVCLGKLIFSLPSLGPDGYWIQGKVSENGRLFLHMKHQMHEMYRLSMDL